MTVADLERAAIEHHRDGLPWSRFWYWHAQYARAIAWRSRDELDRLMTRLCLLVVYGEPPGRRRGDQKGTAADEREGVNHDN